jgi:hypothetical protein
VRAAKDALRTAGRKATVHAARQSPAFPNLLVTPGRRPTRPQATAIERRKAEGSAQPVENGKPSDATGLLRWDSDQD